MMWTSYVKQNMGAGSGTYSLQLLLVLNQRLLTVTGSLLEFLHENHKQYPGKTSICQVCF